MTWKPAYADEFVKKFRELAYGQQRLVEDSIRKIFSSENPMLFCPSIGAARIFLQLESQSERELDCGAQSFEKHYHVSFNWNAHAGVQTKYVK